MHRIDGAGATSDSKFTEGDPASAVPATTVTADWLNAVQEEIISVLAAKNITPAKGSQNQLLLAIQQLVAESSNDLLNTVRINVASATTVNLTAAAPDTSHIRITGSNAINGFTAIAGKCYFVVFSGSPTLTNSASLVTNTGANISVQPGDSCIIRAVSANVVEILCYRQAVPLFSKEYVSAAMSFPIGATYTLTHNFGVRARLVTCTFRCIVANAGYAVGDEVDLSNLFTYPGSNGADGIQIKMQELNQISVKVGAGQILITNQGSTATVIMTRTSWELVVRAYA